MKIKKIAKILTIFSFLSLVNCQGFKTPGDNDLDDLIGDQEEEKPENIKLAKDNNKNYIFDNSVSNKDGSCCYEIFVRSFYDSDNDEHKYGDLNGISKKLPYLNELGVSKLWLMPINPSPSYHGYDITDYYNINPDYGTLEDFKNLINKAADYNIDIIIDLVINHCSNKSKYFLDSLEDYRNDNTFEGSKKDWFNWSDKSLVNYHKIYNQDIYYESCFDSSMPDFNLDNLEVREEIEKISKFWLDLGVKGFRLDAVTSYYTGSINKNVNFLSWFNKMCKDYKKDCYIVGECWEDKINLLKYYSSSCDSFFNFNSSLNYSNNGSILGVTKGVIKAKSFGNYIENFEKELKETNNNSFSSYFLNNHDGDRISKNLEGNLAKLAASIQLLLPGTPYIYYGEEISLDGVRGEKDNDDVKRRLPFIWDDSKIGECGFPNIKRLDLDNTIQKTKGLKHLLNEGYSLTNHYKKVINIRNKYSFIKDSTFKNLSDDKHSKNALIYELAHNDKKIIVCHNVKEYPIRVKFLDKKVKIKDSINTTQNIPSLTKENDLLLGGYSTVILEEI